MENRPLGVIIGDPFQPKALDALTDIHAGVVDYSRFDNFDYSSLYPKEWVISIKRYKSNCRRRMIWRAAFLRYRR